MYGNHFTFKELITTQTDLFNYPTASSHLRNLARLWDVLNYLRDKLGQPIIVNSAFRTPQVNAAVEGDENSFHMQGRAADIRCAPLHMAELWQCIEQYDRQFGFEEKIKYSTFFHIAI